MTDNLITETYAIDAIQTFLQEATLDDLAAMYSRYIDTGPIVVQSSLAAEYPEAVSDVHENGEPSLGEVSPCGATHQIERKTEMSIETFHKDLIKFWKDCRAKSEASGAGMTGVMVDEGLVDWLDNQLHEMTKDEPRSGHDIAAELEAKYDIGLTFGYVGSVQPWADERSYYFFTKVPAPNPRAWEPRLFSWGSCRPENLPHFIQLAEKELEDWIKEKVLPHRHNRYRSYRVEVPNSYSTLVEQKLKVTPGFGGFGSRALGEFHFSIQGMDLDEVKKFIRDIVGPMAKIGVEESPF